jgi:hypothetical protein
MNKHLTVIYAPIETLSGYGANSRNIVKNLIELKKDEWDIQIIPCAWGSTPRNFLDQNQEWAWLKEYIIETPLQKQPDYMFWITIPPEAQKLGKWNCLITAGIESTACQADWIEGCNRMDLVIVSSEHAKKVFLDTKYNKFNKTTNAPEGTLGITTPIEVIGEGVCTNTYKIIENSTFPLTEIKEKFCYLFLGMWIGDSSIPIGEDRKNVSLLIKAFYETFKNKKDKPALILKTSHVNSSYMDREEILKKIKAIKETVNSNDLPNIYLLHGNFSDEEINNLYNHHKVKAMINLTKGEGYGKPLLEFSLMKKPIVTTNWSGHLDFLNPKFTTLIEGTLNNIHPSAVNKWLMAESQWFSPDLGQIGFYLKDVFQNYKKYKEKASKQSIYNKNNFNLEKTKENIKLMLENKVPIIPIEIKMELPKIKLPEVKKLTLPKLEINE